MKKLSILILLLLSVHAHASHIVGGEFRMSHLTGYLYKIELVIYFDEINGLPGSKDYLINAKIFRNSDNAFIRNVQLPMTGATKLERSQSACTINNVLVTSRILYTESQVLEPEIFNDPGGYYIVWERCCRNYTITNIYSNDPTMSSQAAGQTFFLKFPPVVKNGVAYVNSSPQMAIPFIDYACLGRIFYTDFSATDADGDSLVYSIVTPLSTQTFDAVPEILAQPYPEIVWRAPYNAQNIMGGNPDLKISSRGQVTVQAYQQGLFAFAVMCEEYRQGVRIGEVRREYQLLVLDCAADVAPDILVKSTGGSYNNTPLEVHFGNTVADADRCVKVKVTDNDILTRPSTTIRIKAIPIGFNGDVSGVLPTTATAVLSQPNPFAEFSICFDRCPLTSNGFFQIGIVAYDDACSVPLTDTVRISVFIDVTGGKCLRQTINFPVLPDKTFGDPPLALSATSTSGLPVSYISLNTTVASLSASMLTMHKPGMATVIALQAGDDTYKPAVSVERKFCVNPTPPVLTLAGDGPSIRIHSSEERNVWYKDGILQNTLAGSSIPISDETVHYTARVIVDNCVSAMSNSILITGIEAGPIDAIQLFPNPVTNILKLNFEGNSVPKRVELFGVDGQRLFESKECAKTNYIRMDQWDAGVYLLRIENESGVHVRRIFKR